MTIWIIGRCGMLGRDLIATAPADVEIVATGSNEVDIRQKRAINSFLEEKSPQLVVNAAGYTNVDGAENQPDDAFSVNAHAAGSLALACSRRNVPLVHFSTDYVFSGDAIRPYTEGDVTAPVSVYGESKALGERLIEESKASALIVRTQWLFGVHGKSFPRTMWQRACTGQSTRVVDDQWGRPTFTRDLSTATWKLIRERVRGTYHVANTGVATWYDLAFEIFAAKGRADLLARCATAEYKTRARRPRFSVLDTTKFETTAGYALPHWKNALSQFVNELTRDENSAARAEQVVNQTGS